VFGGREVDLRVEIQQQKGADPMLGNSCARDIIEYPEDVAYHAGGGGLGDDLFDFLFHTAKVGAERKNFPYIYGHIIYTPCSRKYSDCCLAHPGDLRPGPIILFPLPVKAWS